MRKLKFRRFRIGRNPLVGLFFILPLMLYYIIILTWNIFVIFGYFFVALIQGFSKSIKHILKIERKRNYEKEETK